MTDFERQEMATLPPKYRPLNAWEYFGYTLLFSIPIVGFICMIVFAFNDSNINRRSFARSYFCSLLIAAIFAGIILASGVLGSFITFGSLY
ncbi:MAG: ABC transporter permease [Ruminococcaceae bacterium]|nr:ABC transporter permease [Oscillospiraceae bacterium]